MTNLSLKIPKMFHKSDWKLILVSTQAVVHLETSAISDKICKQVNSQNMILAPRLTYRNTSKARHLSMILLRSGTSLSLSFAEGKTYLHLVRTISGQEINLPITSCFTKNTMSWDILA